MGLLRCSLFRKSSNYILSSFPYLRVCGFISFRVDNGIAFSNSCLSLGRAKVFANEENKDSAVLPARSFSKISFFKSLKNFALSFKRRQIRAPAALHLYKSLESINFQEFYTFFDMRDTFYSWFTVMELHLWMLLTQLMNLKEDGLEFRNDVIKIFWYEVETRIENLNIDNVKVVKKQLYELSGGLPIAILAYDEGLLSNDMVLANALWFKFFDKHPVDPRKLEVLVRYIRHQIYHLSELNIQDCENIVSVTNIWTPITPHINAVMSQK